MSSQDLELNIRRLRRRDAEGRMQAAWVLINMGQSAVEPLFLLLWEQEEEVRKAAEEALGAIGKPAIPTLIKGLAYLEIRDHVINALAKIGNVVTPSLLAGLDEPHLQQGSALALGRLGIQAAVPKLISLLKNSIVKEEVIVALGELRDKEAVEYLLPFLRSTNEQIRVITATALGKIKDRRAVPALLGSIQSTHHSHLTSNIDHKEEPENVLSACIQALGSIGDPSTVNPLTEMLWHKNIKIRRAGAQALKEIGQPAINSLMEALWDKDIDVKRTAISVLGEIGGQEQVIELFRMMLTTDELTVRITINALANIGMPAATRLCSELQSEVQEIRNAAATALAGIGISAVYDLCKLLTENNRTLRRTAAHILIRIEDQFWLPLRVLKEEKLTPAERAQTLELMRRVRYTDNEYHINYNLPKIDVFCKNVLASDNVSAHQGANEVLSYLQKAGQLLRASQAPSEDPTELLRAAAGGTTTAPEELLRGSAQPKEEENPLKDLWGKIISK